MKRKIHVLLLVLASMMPFCNVKADPSPLQIQLQYVDPEDDQNPLKRTPYPVLYLEGYTLTSADYTLGSTVELIDENDNVVFSTYVSIEGDIQLPTTLSGTYTILVIRDGQNFIGEITL